MVARTVRPPQNRDRGAALVRRQFAFLSLTPFPRDLRARTPFPAPAVVTRPRPGGDLGVIGPRARDQAQLGACARDSQGFPHHTETIVPDER